MWSAILLILGYASVGVILGVVSSRRRGLARVAFLLCGLIVVTTLAVAWPRSWRSWSEFFEFLVQGFYMTVFLDAAILLIPFGVAWCAAVLLLKGRKQAP